MGHDSRDSKKIADRTRIYGGGYDYRLRLADEPKPGAPFTFLAVGDSGSGGAKSMAKYDVAARMAQETDAAFALHLGDVVYWSGSKEGYEDRFVRVYGAWIAQGGGHDDLVFKRPFLPVYGNHDYYDYTSLTGTPFDDLLAWIAGGVMDDLGSGSKNGRVFEEAFVNRDSARVQDGALDYVHSEYTRVPNRYYWFTYGDCAFFALDSNTLDAGAPFDEKGRGAWEEELERARADLAAVEGAVGRRKNEVDAAGTDGQPTTDEFDRYAHELVDAEKRVDSIEKRLDQDESDFDSAQLEWFKRVLDHPDARGKKWKVVYMHHPLFTSDESHTDDPESEGLRANLWEAIEHAGVNLVLTGHSHCFEWVRPQGSSTPTCYVVSGGGGQSLRHSVLNRVRDLDFARDPEALKKREADRTRFGAVAESLAYAGVTQTGADDVQAVHHYLRVTVDGDGITVVPRGTKRVGTMVSDSDRMEVEVYSGLESAGAEVPGEKRRLLNVKVRKDAPPTGAWSPL